MKRYPLAAGAAAVCTLLAACGSPSEPTPTAGAEVVISGFAYSGSLNVKTGQKVTVTNEDPTQHTLTDKTAGGFSTGTIEASGGTETFTAPAKAGSYPFVCRFHPTMQGILTVQGAT
jgi:plastocyanin